MNRVGTKFRSITQFQTGRYDIIYYMLLAQAIGTFALNYLPLITKNKITIQRPFYYTKGDNLRQMCRMPAATS